METWARLGCVAVGLGIAVVGLFALNSPRVKTAFAPQCAQSSCVGQVSADHSVPATTLIIAGLVISVIGLNGARLKSVTGPGGTALGFEELAERALQKAPTSDLKANEAQQGEHPTPGTLPKRDPVARVRVKGERLAVFAPDEIPGRIMADIRQDAPLEVSAKLRDRDVTFGARPAGTGNHPWLLGLDDGSLIKVSYGGQRKSTATVKLVSGVEEVA